MAPTAVFAIVVIIAAGLAYPRSLLNALSAVGLSGKFGNDKSPEASFCKVTAKFEILSLVAAFVAIFSAVTASAAKRSVVMVLVTELKAD